METSTEHTEAERSLLHYMQVMGTYVPYVPFVERWGRLWPAQALPGGYRQGAPQLCFGNAYELACEHDGLTYVEGYAQSAYLATAHAWVVDAKGRVIDNTWKEPERRAYFGVAFSTEFLCEEIMNQEHHGLISVDWQRCNRMLNSGFVTGTNDVGLTVVTGLA